MQSTVPFHLPSRKVVAKKTLKTVMVTSSTPELNLKRLVSAGLLGVFLYQLYQGSHDSPASKVQEPIRPYVNN
jgi:hypothetical protein